MPEIDMRSSSWWVAGSALVLPLLAAGRQHAWSQSELALIIRSW
jgi:hypothetical protein